MTRRYNLIKRGIIALLLLVSVLVIFSVASAAKASVKTDCRFQSMNSGGGSLFDIAIWRAGGGYVSSNYVHYWDSGQWAGVDGKKNTRLPFAEGGKVTSVIGSDPYGGGIGLLVAGTGSCSGWYVSYFHLPELPKWEIGSSISPSDTVGRPGCTGFDCSQVQAHNHVSLFYCGPEAVDGVVQTTFVGIVGTNCQFVDPSVYEPQSQSKGADPPDDPNAGGGRMSLPETPDATPEPPTFTVVEGGRRVAVGIVQAQKPTLVTVLAWQKKPVMALLIILSFLALVLFLRGLAGNRTMWRLGMLSELVVLIVLLSLFLPVIAEQQRAYAAASQPRGVIAALPVFAPPAPVATPEPERIVDPDSNPPEGCDELSNFPGKVSQWCSWMKEESQKNGVPLALIAALVWQESGGDPGAYSHSGAVGLMQVMPRDGLAANFICQNGPCFASRPTVEELKNPRYNLQYGTAMLAGLYTRRGSWREALFAYGPMDVGYSYADTVLKLYQNFK